MSRARHEKTILGLSIFGSGFAALGYQAIWAKQLAAIWGLESIAVMAVVTAFMSGLAIGAFVIAPLTRSLLRPEQAFFRIEFTIGIWAVVSFFVLSWGTELRWSLIPSSLSPISRVGLLFASSTLLFLPATAAMGATLPVMERTWRHITNAPKQLGFVYGLNTFGATLGIVTSVFWLIPTFGLSRTLMGLCGLNLSIAVALWFLGRRSLGHQAPNDPAWNSERTVASARADLFAAFILGLLGMSLQLVSIRILSQTLENTVYTYASILAVYLLGTSSGGFIFQRCSRTMPLSARPFWAIFAISASVALSGHLFAIVPSWHAWVNASFPLDGLRILIFELVTAAAILLIPTTLSGFLFAALTQRTLLQSGRFGRVLGCNLVGAAAAPMVFCLLIPILSIKSLLVVLAISFVFLFSRSDCLRRWPITVVFVALALTVPNTKKLLGVPIDGLEKFQLTQGIGSMVSVVTDREGHKRLELNHRFTMGGSRAAVAEQRQAHLPLLLHPNPENALLLGTGTGITLGAASLYPELTIDAVELVPEVIDQLQAFAPWNGFPYDPERIQLHEQDARAFVKQDRSRYDVIIADVYHPARDGAGWLYTEEHFRTIRNRLAHDGLFCQWLPLHQFDDEGLRSVLRTFHTVFPQSTLWLLELRLDFPILGLLGAVGDGPEMTEGLTTHAARELLEAIKDCQIDSPHRLASSYLGDLDERHYRSAPINTDDRTFVSYHAPWHPRKTPPHESLHDLLPIARDPVPEFSDATPDFLRQNASYLTARNHYLYGQINELTGAPGEALNHYLDGVRSDGTFTLNYASSVAMATRLLSSRRELGIAVLRELARLRPEESLAPRLLQRLDLNSPEP